MSARFENVRIMIYFGRGAAKPCAEMSSEVGTWMVHLARAAARDLLCVRSGSANADFVTTFRWNGFTMKMFADAETNLELEHRILQRIAGRVRNLRVFRDGGRLILEGSSASFHAKQLATHAALELAPADELVNAITVERP